MTEKVFPPGWDEARVNRVLAHYESQSEEEAVAEDEATVEDTMDTVMTVPKPLVPASPTTPEQTPRISLIERPSTQCRKSLAWCAIAIIQHRFQARLHVVFRRALHQTRDTASALPESP